MSLLPGADWHPSVRDNTRRPKRDCTLDESAQDLSSHEEPPSAHRMRQQRLAIVLPNAKGY